MNNCLHSGYHVAGLRCPDCGKFSRHSWQTDWIYTENGGNQYWGGECKYHGAWSDSAA